MAENKKKWYRLGGSASALWDPSQSDPKNQFLNANEAKQLELTPRVQAAIKGEGLVALDEDEAKQNISAAVQAEASKKSEADKVLEQADSKLEEAKVIQRKNDNLNKALDDLQDEHDDLKADHDKLKAAVADPDQNPALKGALDENAALKARVIELEKSAAEGKGPDGPKTPKVK